jgi:hypothetical protein
MYRGDKSDRSPQSTLLAPRRLAYLEIHTSPPHGCREANRQPQRANPGIVAGSLKLALALLWERRDERPGAVSVLVCQDEVVVECNAQQAEDVKVWLQKAMIEGMDAITNGRDEVQVPVEVEARIARSWGEGG